MKPDSIILGSTTDLKSNKQLYIISKGDTVKLTVLNESEIVLSIASMHFIANLFNEIIYNRYRDAGKT